LLIRIWIWNRFGNNTILRCCCSYTCSLVFTLMILHLIRIQILILYSDSHFVSDLLSTATTTATTSCVNPRVGIFQCFCDASTRQTELSSKLALQSGQDRERQQKKERARARARERCRQTGAKLTCGQVHVASSGEFST